MAFWQRHLSTLDNSANGAETVRQSIQPITGRPSRAIASQVSEPLFRFASIGDVGTGDDRQYAVARAMQQRWQAEPFATVLMAGDNIYDNGEIEKISEVFERPYESLLQTGVKFYAALGNHDVRTRRGDDQVRYEGYNMGGRYYTFRQESVQFFALDTNQDRTFSSHRETPWMAQLGWLERELRRSPALWKVVYGHHPIYASGRHGSNRSLAGDLAPLFERYGVQLYINGHDHHYERTQPLEGTTYITSGNGAKLRPVRGARWTAHAASKLGFTVFAVYPDKITVKAVDTGNAVYDEACLTNAWQVS